MGAMTAGEFVGADCAATRGRPNIDSVGRFVCDGNHVR